MPITAHQLRQRKGHLGSSDVAALFGLSKFQSAVDVWLEKTGQVEPEDEQKEWLALGNEFEPVILDRVERQLGPLRRNQYRSARDRGLPLASNIDALVVESGRPVEAKTSGIWWPVEEPWGEPGTDQVPDRVMIQAHVHLICTDTDLCHTPKMGWGMRQDLYAVPRDEDMVRQICDYTAEWWQRHVIEGRRPEGTPRAEMLRRMIREPEKAVEVPDELVLRWRRAVKLASRVERIKKDAQTAVLAAMGDAEIGTCSLGTVTYFASQRSAYSVAPKTTRTARWKEHKAAE
jgi:putative phage-type endonuclease